MFWITSKLGAFCTKQVNIYKRRGIPVRGLFWLWCMRPKWWCTQPNWYSVCRFWTLSWPSQDVYLARFERGSLLRPLGCLTTMLPWRWLYYTSIKMSKIFRIDLKVSCLDIFTFWTIMILFFLSQHCFCICPLVRIYHQ